MSSEIETDFQAAIDTGKINGAIICATDAQGHFVYDRALGQRTLLSGEHRPQQLDDVLYLASATKLMTTIAALQCVEDGLLTLDGDLSSIAPELAAKQVITGFSEDDEEPILQPLNRPITLEMLLTHSSGATYDFMNPLLMKWRKRFDNFPPDAKRRVEDAFAYPLTFQPGEGWMYGPNLDWAGRIVERVTRGTLGSHMHQRIFSPLGITDAEFYPVTRPELRERLVDLNPSDPEAHGLAVTGQTEANKRSEGDFGGHALFMTAPDYVKVLHSLLRNDGKILKPQTVDDMFQNHLTRPDAAAGHEAAMDGPMGMFFRVGTDPGSKAGFGLGGLLTMQDLDGWYGEGTLTWGGGLTFAWFVDRKNDLCGVAAVLSALPLDGKLISDLKQSFRRGIYRERTAWKAQQG
ncbi:hypothetical protein B0A52_08467 [Exophiala mesophila]|uniref:Beta-lactamase-related domain-containing protein n=1 Tax=Exophiala mesophila TaxID=212818 RepID=A0A438MVS2_EXOME|nr:hypothetical protein B0A52_08467 [Exophiala mesophila]